MVVCLACKKVVWAYDSLHPGDARGLLNMMRMPCRLCGELGNFDGWSVDPEYAQQLGAYDGWNAMHRIAEAEGYTWEASSDNVWFREKVPVNAQLLAALKSIAEHPEGAYSRDKETYLKNVIEWCQETARAAIAAAQQEASP